MRHERSAGSDSRCLRSVLSATRPQQLRPAAKADWQAGRFELVPGEDKQRIELPG